MVYTSHSFTVSDKPGEVLTPTQSKFPILFHLVYLFCLIFNIYLKCGRHYFYQKYYILKSEFIESYLYRAS